MGSEPKQPEPGPASRAWQSATGGLLRVSALTVVLLAVLAFVVLTLLTREVLQLWPWEVTPKDKDSRATYADLVKVSLAVAGGTGAAVGLVVAYRRQKHAEADDAGKRSRYAGAAQQLGDPQAAVRMAGAYAMANLADEWPEQRQQCVDVLCAYLRLPWAIDDPYNVEPSMTTIQRTYPTGEGRQRTETRVYQRSPGEREVRRTMTRIIAEHCRSDVAVTWSTLRLDLAGATLVGGDFTHTTIDGSSSFDGARFIAGAGFGGATFSGTASFEGATFSGDAWFGGATFSGGASFEGATFSGTASFEGATFSGAAWFGGATFSGRAAFEGATFSGAAWLGGATFFGGALFEGATFSGGVWFDRATFSSGAWFGRATFSGDAWFGGATFSGAAAFGGTTFSGTAWFGGATFSGDATFAGATFSGTASFDGATFSGAAWFQRAGFEANTSWRRAHLPSRTVFDTCRQPPAPSEIDAAIFRDQRVENAGY